MPLEPRSGKRGRQLPALSLPPPFRQVALREVGDAFAHATRIAAEEGAGTLVHVGRFDLVEFALVLEPDEPLRSARRAFYAGLNAMVDALVAFAPPEKFIAVDWPGAIFVDGGLVGGGRLAWPQGADEEAVAPWLVFGGMLRAVAMEDDPGLHPNSAALDQEGFEEFGADRLVESFARHFMVALDAWQEQGFDAIAKAYLPRLGAASGMRRAIDKNGDLLIQRLVGAEIDKENERRSERMSGQGLDHSSERRSLIAALSETSWFDRETGGPRL